MYNYNVYNVCINTIELIITEIISGKQMNHDHHKNIKFYELNESMEYFKLLLLLFWLIIETK
jgi:hypothetical protein